MGIANENYRNLEPATDLVIQMGSGLKLIDADR